MDWNSSKPVLIETNSQSLNRLSAGLKTLSVPALIPYKKKTIQLYVDFRV